MPLEPSLGDVRGVRSFSLFVPVASTNAEYRIRVSFTERAVGVFGLRDKFLETYTPVLCFRELLRDLLARTC